MDTSSYWDAPYETGIEFIDQQHRGLFEILRRLERTAALGEAHTEMATVLAALEIQAPRHFADEEAYMARIRFPGLLDHCVEHRVFLIRLRNLKESCCLDEIGTTLEATHFLFTWLRDHILDHDLAIAHHARALSRA